jgi:hypothetical protein
LNNKTYSIKKVTQSTFNQNVPLTARLFYQ